jgi:exosortase D (VPLPA-CTERM-specific)
MILSLTLFCFGKDMFKVLVLPLSLLIFMIPLPTMFGTLIGVRLKLISTLLGEIILRAFGVSVFVEGNVIDLGVTKLQVVDACSGLRYILPLLTLGVLFSYFLEKVRWKQVVLVVSTIPIAVITNGIRIGITGLLAHYYSLEAAEGFFHGFSGWLIFMVAFAFLFALYWLLRVLFKKAPPENPSAFSKEGKQGGVRSRNTIIPIVISSAFLILLALLSHTTAALPTLNIRDGLSNFPLKIRDWEARAETIDRQIISLSGAQDAFSATYGNSTGNIVTLYIGYRGSPFNESENFFHSPNVCLPSGGWKTLAITKHTVTDVPRFGDVTVRKMVSQKMGQKHLVYYWFQTKDRTSFDVNINRFHLAWHAMQRDNTHDLFIRPITHIQPTETIEDAEVRMDQFVRDMMVTLLKFLEENQVEGSM